MFTWTYDKLDRVLTETYPDGSVVAWTYDVLGRRSTMTDPDGRVTVYTYGSSPSNKGLAQISDDFGKSANYIYGTDGRLAEEVYRQNNNDLSVNYWNYDSAGRVGSLGHYSFAEMAIIRLEQYTYNAASMRTRIDYSSDGFVQPYHKLYSYDALGQLTQEHKRWTGNNASAYRYAYTYDPAGNRTQLVHYNGSSTQTVASTYNDGNQLVTQSGEPISYDSNGNVHEISDLIGYNHNADNRLTAAYDAWGQNATYYYDALGRRIGRKSGDGVTWTRYYYDGLNILMTRENSPATGAAWRTRRAYTLKQASIGQIIAEHTATAWTSTGTPSVWNHQFYHFDLLGNTTANTDATGMVSNIIDMEAFGTVLQGGQDGFRLTTKEYDPEARAYYFNARWYAVSIGKFLESAPTFPFTEHNYALSDNTPTLRIDPTGQQPSPPFPEESARSLGNDCAESGVAGQRFGGIQGGCGTGDPSISKCLRRKCCAECCSTHSEGHRYSAAVCTASCLGLLNSVPRNPSSVPF